jgi:hypothetical protein
MARTVPGMDLHRLAAGVLIAGAVLFLIAAVPMPGIYGIQDADARLAKIRADETAFYASHVLFAVGAIVVALGFVLLAAWLVARRDPMLPAVGAAAMVVGAALWTWFMVDRAANPDAYFRDYGHVPGYVWASALATSIGLAAFALVFIGFEGPGWVGYLTLAVVALTLAIAVVAPDVVPPQLLYLPPLVMGAVLQLSQDPAIASHGAGGVPTG